MEHDDGRVSRPLPHVAAVTSSSVDIVWADDPAATGWLVRQVPGSGRYKATGQPCWRSEGLQPSTMYEFVMMAVDDDHGEWSEKGLIHVETLAWDRPTCLDDRPGPAVAGGGFEPPTFRL